MNTSKIYRIILFLVCPLLFLSCSNDDKNEHEEGGNNGSGNQLAVGLYKGVLEVELEVGENKHNETIATQYIQIEKRGDKNELSTTIRELVIDDVEYGSLKMPAAYTVKDNLFDLNGYSNSLKIPGVEKIAIQLKGTIESGVAHLKYTSDELKLEDGRSAKLHLLFDGEKTDQTFINYFFGFENWLSSSAAGYTYTIPAEEVPGMEWSSTDAEVARYISMHTMSEFSVRKSGDAFNGDYSAEVHTLEVQQPIAEIYLPKIYGGLLYLGRFVDDEIVHPHEKAWVGVPFSGIEPISIQGFYQYKPGTTYYRCPDVNHPELVVEDPTEKDAMLIQAVLYEVTDVNSEEEVLKLKDLKSASNIVAQGEFSSTQKTDGFTEFDFSLKWKEGKVYSADKQYLFSLLVWSSKNSLSYSGAPGSKLLLDNLKIIVKE